MGEEIGASLANDLLYRLRTQEIGHGLVGGDEAALGILEVDQVRQGVNEGPQQIALFSQCVRWLQRLSQCCALALLRLSVFGDLLEELVVKAHQIERSLLHQFLQVVLVLP